MDEELDGEDFGVEVPPLAVYIKGIIERYPAGQIFKELIQNADDAGARKVHFFLDSRTHSPHSLINPALAQFQGPALLAYNDAQFTAQDWKNIQKPQQSFKQDDPLKVGKFGIGFNSVYHITDLPTVISGRKVAFMEPLGKIWRGKFGRRFPIDDPKIQTVLAPFNAIYECSTNGEISDHTLFCFPLRQSPSELSETCYSVDMLHKLLEALKEEAQYLLLFLRSVTEIRVFEISSSSRPEELFKVKICEHENISAKRKTFRDVQLARVQHSQQSECYSENFHVETHDSVCGKTEKHWLVVNTVGSERRCDWSEADKLKVLPWAGCALELSEDQAMDVSASDSDLSRTGSDDETSPSKGRIFCFLPMPKETCSPLPVHVNGTFGLNDDRRTLKWPSGERLHDPNAKWNMTIINYLLPTCYAELLLEAIKVGVPPREVYNAWPQMRTLKDTNWSGLLEPLLGILFQKEVFWYVSSTKPWVSLNNATFIPKGEELSSVIKDVLSHSGLRLVNVPDHVWDALDDKEVNKVSPTLLRHTLRSHSDVYKHLLAEDKHKLLLYCLSDEQYEDLIGLKLLPSVNGAFHTFKSGSSAEVYYVCSDQHPRSLLPKLEDHLVDLSSIHKNLHTKLLKVASSEKTQLQQLNAKSVSKLLSLCMPDAREHHNAVPVSRMGFPWQWFELFWKWVQCHDLQLFTGQMVLPIVRRLSEEQHECWAAKLVTESKVIFISHSDILASELLTGLEKIGLYFTGDSDNLFPYLQPVCRKLLSYKFVNSVTPEGVLRAIAHSCRRNLRSLQDIEFNDIQALALQRFISRKGSLVDEHKQVVLWLPIFKAVNRETVCSIESASKNSWNHRALLECRGFDISSHLLPPELVVFSSDHNETGLIHLYPHKVSVPTKTEFIQNVLIPMISAHTYPDHLLDDLMVNILQQLPTTSPDRQNLCNKLSDLPFLKCNSTNSCKAPNQLFDISKKELKDLFRDKPVFPQPPFTQTHLLTALRECGLRQYDSVSAQEIVDVILSVSTELRSSARLSTAKAIVRYLEKHPQLLSQKILYESVCHNFNEVLPSISRKTCWLPVEVKPPKRYPKCLEWRGRSCTSALTMLNSSVLICCEEERDALSFILGSQLCIVSCSPKFCEVLQNHVPLDHVHVGLHFQQVIANCQSIDDEDILHYIVRQIYKHFSMNLQHDLQNILPTSWLWIRKHSTFVTSQKAALHPHPSLYQDLDPYLFVVPEDLREFSNFFKKLGVVEYFTKSQVLSVLSTIKEERQHSQKSWKIVIDILNWLAKDSSVTVDTDDTLYVPIESEESDALRLEDSNEVYYADDQGLKEFLNVVDEKYTLCHDQISHLAQRLGITPLSQHLDISDDMFDDVGQHEPLEVRIRGILRDYTDGLTIIKELLQNADDAGATEVNLCYDARQQNVDPKTLLFSGMAKSYGPALIVHNDAEFTDEDFQNITKLAAVTKQNKPLKIGKFGVGFCSVYHITDVPSFVSREYLYIFDPTLQYLEKQIRDRSNPGKRLKFTKKVVTFSNQLVPFHGLNGFDSKNSFKGTMFRFPFRSSSSKISSIQYTEDHVMELIEDIKKSSSKLLLFLQHVKHITVSQIEEGGRIPRLILDIQRDVSATVTPETKILSIRCNGSSPSHEDVWLMGFCTEKLDFCGQERDAIASIACQLHSFTSSDPQRYTVKQISGEVFCFLPLSLQSGLPVHVSANFAVSNDRRGIHSSHEHSTAANEAEWNVDLMKSTIPQAYLNLLLGLSQMYTEGDMEKDYSFYSLWPLKEQFMVHNPWDNLIAPLYYKLAKKPLLFSSYTRAWLTLSESKFLSPGTLCRKQGEALSSVQDVIQILQMAFVDLPQTYKNHLPAHSTIQELDFVKIIFERIVELAPHCDTRNKVLLLIIQTYAHSHSQDKADLESILKGNQCVPCTPDGEDLKHCHEVIDHTAFFADLYELDDGVFAIEEFQEYSTHQALIKLGMITGNLPLSKVAERAKTVQGMYSSNRRKALERTRLILKCVEKFVSKPVKHPYISRSSSHLAYDIDGSLFEQLKAVKFLPVQQRPKDYPAALSWKGEKSILLAANELYYGEHCVTLAGSQICIVCTEKPEQGGCGPVDSRTISKLEIETEPPFSAVVKHLCHIVQEFATREVACDVSIQERPISKEWIYNVCSQIYNFLEVHLAQDICLDLSVLNDVPCIWTGSCFTHLNRIAKRWKHNGPYLFQLPSYLENKAHILEALKVKDQFSVQDMVDNMRKMKEDFGCEPISRDCHSILHSLMIELKSRMKKSYSDTQRVVCYLPDANNVMRKADELDYNDAPWCEVDQSTATFVHPDIPRDFAIKVGVRPVRSKFLDQYEDDYEGEEFGQCEDLTQRIKNILRDYPLDITILKELLQNADDAKATKMYIILDKRTHGLNTLPSDEWKDLQGPALLVWNDSTFREEDFKGIQKLGLGSKRSEAEMIGMYGIGFNAVYHLTDCPSFISTEENGKSTLCVLDPHCRYIPGAKKLRPGRRFNDLDQKFWTQWSDLRSAYFQDDIPGLPSEMKSGSLFRFPLRHSQELVDKSEILESSSVEKHKPLQAGKLQEELEKWAPDMKKTLFFLNNVTEIRFYVVDDAIQLHLLHWYMATIDGKGQECRRRIQNKVHHFGKSNPSPHVERYLLTLTDKLARCEEDLSEKWCIQQGVGDIHSPEKHWQHLPQMKPKHGIAAPLCTSGKASEMRLHSRVFCFLPLPISANLPVHVNGSFVLDSSRRKLWQSTDPDHSDKKTKWNNSLMEAIASSYAKLLVEFQDAYIDPSGSESEDALLRSIMKYYSTFPIWLDENPPEGQCLTLAKRVYAKLNEHNASVLVHVRKEMLRYKADYLPLKNEQRAQDQAYFHGETVNEEIVSILKKIGMHLTAAPQLIYEHFLACHIRVPEATRHNVFTYYAEFYSSVSPNATFPHLITDTKFGSLKNFKALTKYLLGLSIDGVVYGTCQFPSSPFGIPLLLTADNQLKKFDKNNKAIRSKFSSLFHGSSDRFLHPEMMDVKYSKDYFLKPSADKNWQTVCDIMSRTLPEQLKCPMVLDASEYTDIIKHLWTCFSEDPFFNGHMQSVLKTWAVIPSTQNQLFSLQSNILPILMVVDNHFSAGGANPSSFENIFKILEKFSMPILNRDTVCSEEEAKTFCPMVTKPATIVKNLYHLHQERQVLDSTTLLQFVAKPLLEYFGTIHLAYDPATLHMIKLLPLFKNIDGRFCPIPYGAFIWPGHVCDAGRDLWLQGDRCVFLDKEGDWVCLKATESLNIQPVSPFGVYNKYIFPVFENLSQEQMMDHLKNIKDHLFDDAEQYSESLVDDRREDAKEFIQHLKALHCLQNSDGKLQPVSEFVDPKKKIFYVFPTHFNFPPQVMQAEPWLKFLRRIGLRSKVTTEEFLQFCYQVERGNHSDITLASQTLLEYLFQEQEWHKDNDPFLGQVSKIPFVCADSLPSVSWIKACAPSEKTVVGRERTVVHLTSLQRAADHKDYKYIWTVKPIVHLPHYPREKQKRAALLQSLRVLEATVDDVIKNIKNISGTQFSDFQMFDTYSCKIPKQGENLFCVLNESFHFLKDASCTLVTLSPLKDVPCIPVCAEGTVDNVTHPVLVKPLQVIALSVSMLRQFRPFLNPLPNDLYSILPHLLAPIGVEQVVMLKHVQGALETIHTCTEQPLDVNTQVVVQCLIHKLYELLSNQEKAVDSETLSPLYLPSLKYCLVDSTTLIYLDSEHFRKKNFKFTESEYSQLSFLVNDRDVMTRYKFHEKQLCQLLPLEITPKPLSTSCIEIMSESCHVAPSLSPLAQGISRAFNQPLLTKGACAIMKHNSNSSELCERLKESLDKFFSNAEIFTVRHLTVDVWLTIETPSKHIGTAEVDFHIKKKDNNAFQLYIDEAARKIFFYETLSSAIMSLAAEISGVAIKDIKEPQKSLMYLLKAENSSEVQSILKELNVPLDNTGIDATDEDGGETFNPNLEPKLGSPIPEPWHHRLQQDINNLFVPGEWVGYEEVDDVIVFALIGYRIKNEVEGVGQELEPYAKYLIYVEEGESDGIEVSVINLYKFLRSARKEQERDGEQALIVYEGRVGEDVPREAPQSQNLTDIKKEICKELKRIWNLPEDLRRKALKRLYLRWHPDKNLDNPALAEEAFKFLKQQIARLEAGKPLNDPEKDEDHTTHDSPSSFWESWFETWNYTAHRHNRHQRRQRRWFSGSSSGRTGDRQYDSAFASPSPDPFKARVWIRQAECDFKALKVLSGEMHRTKEVCANACFLAHEVAEKSLKAGMLAACGLRSTDFSNHRKLYSYACALEQMRPALSARGLLKLVEALPLEEYYYKTRWPNYHPCHQVPADKFDQGHAREAEMNADAVLRMMKTVVDGCN